MLDNDFDNDITFSDPGYDSDPSFLTADELVTKAYLEVQPPHQVAEWIKNNISYRGMIDTLPMSTVHALLARDEPLINLALAQYGDSKKLLKHLYNRYDNQIKCAVLCNTSFGEIFSDTNGLQFWDPGQFKDFISSGPTPLLDAYFSNPSIHADVLKDLFLKRNLYEGLDHNRWAYLLFRASENPSLCSYKKRSKILYAICFSLQRSRDS